MHSQPAAPIDALEHLTGIIERVTFHSPETGFGVMRVKVRGQRDLVTVVGTAPSSVPEQLRACTDADGEAPLVEL